MHNHRQHLILTCLLFFFIFQCLRAQIPMVKNHQATDYDGELQNWCGTQLKSGVMCFANNNGVLTFDGYTWQNFKMSGSHIVRSVLAQGDTIFAGSFQEFGYFVKNREGNRTYRSLSAQIKPEKIVNNEFWSVVRIGNDVYFQSFEQIFRFNKATGKVSKVSGVEKDTGKDMRPLHIFNYKGRLLAQGLQHTLYRLERGGWKPVPGAQKIDGRVVGIAKDIFATDKGRLFTLTDDGEISYLTTEADAELAQYGINRIINSKNGDLVIGTSGKGIYLISKSGKLLWHMVRRESELCNNMVLGLCLDRSGNIWAMLDEGISMIQMSSPVKMAFSNFYQNDIGMVYGIGRTHSGTILVATNQNAFSVNPNGINGEFFQAIPGTKGQNWCIRTFDLQTFIGGNENSMEIMPDNSHVTVPGAITDMKRGTINGEDVVIQASYYDFTIYRRNPSTGLWEKSGIVKDIGMPSFRIETDNDGTLWAQHIVSGIMRIKLSTDLTRAVEKEFYPTPVKGKEDSKPILMKIRGKVVFADNKAFYVYDEASDSFKPFKELNEQLPGITGAVSATAVDDSRFWLATSSAYHLIKYSKGDYTTLLTVPFNNFPRKMNGMNCGVFTDGEKAYFNLNGGIGILNMAGLDNPLSSAAAPCLEIASVGYLSRDKGFIAMPMTVKGGKIPKTGERNLRIVLSYPNFTDVPLHYRFILDGAGKKATTESNTPEASFPYLTPSTYTLTCQVLDDNNRLLASLDYEFKVPQPWALQWWSIIIYIIIAIGGILLISRLYARYKLKEERRQSEQERARQEHEIHRQQLVIAEQQKKLLQQELSKKGKELASMALTAYSRQQTIQDLMKKLSESITHRNTAGFNALSENLKTLAKAESGSDDLWNTFENNFDLIHDHFFRNLRHKYPQLTAKDLRICALTRLNLSTKDMARFQNMSVRGVETARYRLRKKLGLASDVNLTEFMIDFAGEKDGDTSNDAFKTDTSTGADNDKVNGKTEPQDTDAPPQ